MITFWNGEPVATSLTCTSNNQRMPDKGKMQMIVQPTYSLQGAGQTSKSANGSGINEEVSFTLSTVDVHGVAQSMAVRRLTPMDCERLQGFPDGYTDIKLNGKPTPDGPRYKALGNSMAVPVMRWIGQRIEAVDRIK